MILVLDKSLNKIYDKSCIMRISLVAGDSVARHAASRVPFWGCFTNESLVRCVYYGLLLRTGLTNVFEIKASGADVILVYNYQERKGSNETFEFEIFDHLILKS